MNISLLLSGFFIGLTVAATIGPIGLLCIQKTLHTGWTTGFAVGLGAALADATYGLVGALGIAAITTTLISFQWILQLLGALFVGYLGITTFGKRISTTTDITTTSHTFFGATFSTFLLTLSNPITIITFTSIFAGFDINQDSLIDSLIITKGVFLGSVTWFLCLTTLVAIMHTYLPKRWLNGINKLSGMLLIGFALYSIVDLIRDHYLHLFAFFH